jgi:hypothetical protein
MKSNVFPFWMIAASGFLALNVLVLALTLYFNPSIFFNSMHFDSDSMLMLSQRFAAVLLALGISIFIALFMQSISMLKITMASYCIITLQDTVIGFAYDDTGLMIRSFIFCVLAAFIVFISNGMKPKRKRMRFLRTNNESTKQVADDDDD